MIPIVLLRNNGDGGYVDTIALSHASGHCTRPHREVAQRSSYRARVAYLPTLHFEYNAYPTSQACFVRPMLQHQVVIYLRYVFPLKPQRTKLKRAGARVHMGDVCR